MQAMYPGIPFSPPAALTQTISETDTVIHVDNVDAFPDAPNYATIGTDEQAETIRYSAKGEGILSGCTRAVEGTAKVWQTGEVIARNFTAQDLQIIQDNLSSLDSSKADKVADATSGHLAGLNASGNLTDSGKTPSDFAPSSHVNDTVKHLSEEEHSALHSHTNKAVLDAITEEKVKDWDKGAIYQLSCTKQGKVFALSGAPDGIAQFTAKFTAPGDYAAEDTFTLDSVPYTAKKINGEKLSAGDFISGAKGVQVEVDTAGHTLDFKLGSRSDGYRRPEDWLPEPEIDYDGNESVLYLLMAIYDTTANPVAFKITSRTTSGSSASYSVDWGDGHTNTYSSGQVATHNFSYGDVSASSESSRGYRQAWMKVSGINGGLIKEVDLQQKNGDQSSSGIVQIKANLPQCDVLNISKSNPSLYFNQLEVVDIRTLGNVTSMSGMFSTCCSLKKIVALDTSKATTLNALFRQCRALEEAPDLDLTAATSLSEMFYNCSCLTRVPKMNLQRVTSTSRMFYGCAGLTQLPALNTSSATTMGSMFSGCNSLQSIADIDTSSATDLSSIFYMCYSITRLPILDLSNATNMNSAFRNCYGIRSVELKNIYKNIDLNGVTAYNCNLSFEDSMLSKEQIVAIFNGLPTCPSDNKLTITITDTPGSSSLTSADRAIATNKNWTITG